MMRIKGLAGVVLVLTCVAAQGDELAEPVSPPTAQLGAEERVAYYGPGAVAPERWSGGWWPPQYGERAPRWQRQRGVRPYWNDRYRQPTWRGGSNWQQPDDRYGKRFPSAPYRGYSNGYGYRGGGGWQGQRDWRNPPGFANPYGWRDVPNARPWQRYGNAGWEFLR